MEVTKKKYSNPRDIEAALQCGESLAIGYEVSYIDAWTWYLSLMITSTRASDHIVGLRGISRYFERPLFGPFAKQPTFDYMNEAYRREWNEFIQQKHTEGLMLEYKEA